MKGCVYMSLFTFKKGLHLPYNKSLTKDKDIEILKPSKTLIFPLSQHIGAPCTPIVKIGDRVLENEKIADSKEYISSPIHSSVSGFVQDIKEISYKNGLKSKAIFIENDFKYESFPLEDYKYKDSMNIEDFVSLIRERGIVGLGGATFPSHVKLNIKNHKEVKYIIINGAECEPYLTCDYKVMTNYTEEIIKALKILSSYFPKALIYIGIEDNKLDALEKFKIQLKDCNKIFVFPLKTKYPQGSEKHLIYTLTKIEIPRAKIPLDLGCIVFNISTIYQMYKSLTYGTPLTDRVITVTGDALCNPKNLRVKIGTPISDIIDFCGGFIKEPKKIILGGPMMGNAINSLNTPITKGTSGIISLSKEVPLKETSCIRCGKCINSCPMNLIPQRLNELSTKENLKEFEALGGMNCLECGCCAYSCPAKISLVQNIRKAKKSFKNKI